MKTTKLITLGVILGSSSFVAADRVKPDGPPPERPQMRIPAEILNKFDKDGDGKLSPDEAKAAREARQAEMMKKFDKNGDGELSEDERKAMHAEMKARYEELLAKYDADKDGKLSPDEIKTAREAGEKLPMMMGRGLGGPGAPERPGGPDGHRVRRGGDKGQPAADGAQPPAAPAE
jgi:Ca2+-binding EF-hand superfamily protein